MGVVFSLLLIVMGALIAKDFISEKMPASKSFLEMLEGQGEYIGLAGLMVGLLWFMNALNMMRFFSHAPLHVIEAWIASGLTMLLGLMLVINLLNKIVGEPTPSFFNKLAKMCESLVPYKKVLGLSGMVLGLIYLL
jgi:hypothetical protein